MAHSAAGGVGFGAGALRDFLALFNVKLMYFYRGRYWRRSSARNLLVSWLRTRHLSFVDKSLVSRGRSLGDRRLFSVSTGILGC